MEQIIDYFISAVLWIYIISSITLLIKLNKKIKKSDESNKLNVKYLENLIVTLQENFSSELIAFRQNIDPSASNPGKRPNNWEGFKKVFKHPVKGENEPN